jgi:hypothetical protein
MSELHVFTASEEEWVIAASSEDACAVYCATIGCEPSKAADDGGTHPDDWEALPDDKSLTRRDDDGGRQTMTCGEWARLEGRGYWGSASA